MGLGITCSHAAKCYSFGMVLLKSLALSLSLWLHAFGASPIPMATAVLIESAASECSGTVIASHRDRTMVLTAAHCVDGDKLLYIQIGGLPARYSHVAAITVSIQYDLATIELTGTGDQPIAKIADSGLIREGNFTLVGLSSTVPWALSKGYAMGDPVEVHYSKYHGLDIPLACMGCDEGDSGSGLFNDRGELVGVLVAGSHNNAREYGITLSDVRKFLWATTKIK